MATGTIKHDPCVYEKGTYNETYAPTLGFVTSGGALLVIFVILSKNAYGKSLTVNSWGDSSQMRLSTGGYLGDPSTATLSDSGNYGNSIYLALTKSGGWGATNNTIVGGRFSVNFTLS